MNLPAEVTMFQIAVGTVGLALLTLLVGLVAVKLLRFVFDEKPGPLQDGETTASRISGLRWE